jgi:hypothetical protein
MSEETQTVSEAMEQQTPDISDTSDIKSEEKDFVTAEDQAPARPEWLPEKFKTPEALLESYSNLEKKQGQKESDIREAWEKELNEQAYADRPESAGDYVLPKSIDESLAPDNKMLDWWSKFSWENGMSQEEFEAGINMFEQEREAIVGSIESNREDEVKKLGDNAEERIQATALFAQKFFPENLMPAIERLTETSEGIQAIEHIMENIKQGGNIDTEPANRLDLQTLESMMNDERYWNPAKKDLNYIREVTEGYNKLNGVG